MVNRYIEKVAEQSNNQPEDTNHGFRRKALTVGGTLTGIGVGAYGGSRSGGSVGRKIGEHYVAPRISKNSQAEYESVIDKAWELRNNMIKEQIKKEPRESKVYKAYNNDSDNLLKRQGTRLGTTYGEFSKRDSDLVSKRNRILAKVRGPANTLRRQYQDMSRVGEHLAQAPTRGIEHSYRNGRIGGGILGAVALGGLAYTGLRKRNTKEAE